MDSQDFAWLTADHWSAFERLFGARGACEGCWCMYHRLLAAEYKPNRGENNRAAMRALVERGAQPGILGFHEGQAVGWVSVSPREAFPRLDKSRVAKPFDDQSVWSVTCLFVVKEMRRKGVSVALLRAAIGFVKARGGRILEGYPIIPKKDSVPPVFAFPGLISAFHAAGFRTCAQRSETRALVRYDLG